MIYDRMKDCTMIFQFVVFLCKKVIVQTTVGYDVNDRLEQHSSIFWVRHEVGMLPQYHSQSLYRGTSFEKLNVKAYLAY